MAHSYVAAAEALYGTLTAALFPGGTRPPFDFGEASATTSTGAQKRVPYVVLTDLGSDPEYQSDYGGQERGGFELTVYAKTVTDLDTIVTAIRFNGDTPAAKAGFDFGTLTLDAPYYALALTRTREVREYVAPDRDGLRVHRCRITYRVDHAVDPAATPA